VNESYFVWFKRLKSMCSFNGEVASAGEIGEVGTVVKPLFRSQAPDLLGKREEGQA
jgi:hypothetical protein